MRDKPFFLILHPFTRATDPFILLADTLICRQIRSKLTVTH